MGADNENEKILLRYLYLVDFIKVGILEGITKLNYKGGEKMGKNKNNQLNNKNAPPTKADAEIAGENGLEKIALKAQKSKNK